MSFNRNNLPKYPYSLFEDNNITIYLLQGKSISGKFLANFQYEILIETKTEKENGDTVLSEVIVPKHSIKYVVGSKKIIKDKPDRPKSK
ncbi:hypothetical protein [Staphylococcus aureus]|uniref:hypothetical protein n=1 Tax=Staphylococcus aureus TaxID=1280 RepID=UPI000DE33994|nr:hypothetical protein [Staphylococcus aureus]MDN8674495.1 hypothetical protein [Staphylococcus aureus]MDN8977712.1 hypothetical protein [Staphylococcus aureus]